MRRLTKLARTQLLVLVVLALVGVSVIALRYMKLPAVLLGVGHYTVTLELPEGGGLYDTSNVTYRGAKVGKVKSIKLTATGVEAKLALTSDIDIPSNLKAEVHSMSAVGEQYVDLLPQNGSSAPLKNGDVIPAAATSVPPSINQLLDAVNVGLAAVPQANLKTAVDEAYTAVGGLGPELSRLVDGSLNLSIDARKHLDSVLKAADFALPVLESQNETSDAIHAWAANLATVTKQLQTNDESVGGVLKEGSPTLNEFSQLFQRLQPTLPTALANAHNVGRAIAPYSDDIEQLLAVFPAQLLSEQAGVVANTDTKQAYRGQYLSFNLNVNLPPPCTTGFLPAQQIRNPSIVDYPDRMPGSLYCRIAHDAPNDVRGARNTPCRTRPGKRAATVKLCESDEPYVPLNEGWNWKGDPNATYTGQDIPELPPGFPGHKNPAEPPPPALPPMSTPEGSHALTPAAEYDPITGNYIGVDGRVYGRNYLDQTMPRDPRENTWQSMLTPPTGN